MFNKFYVRSKDSGIARASWYMQNCMTSTRTPWFYSYNISHRGIVSICRMRCGHISLLESLFRFSIVPSPNCPACDTPESLDHIFWQCGRFVEQRGALIKRLIKSIGSLPIPVRTLLILLDEKTIYAVDSFINSININI